MFFAPTVVRRNAYVSPRALDRTLERLLDTAFTSARNPASLAQDDTTYTLTLDLPGVDKAQLAIQIEDQFVRINTTAEAPRPFKAAYELPTEIDAAASQAKLENGVLTLTLGKKVPVSHATTLAIN